jgi:hypothetical protein
MWYAHSAGHLNPMKRWTLRIAIAISLVVGVVVAGLWATSHTYAVIFEAFDRMQVRFSSVRGRVNVTMGDNFVARDPPYVWSLQINRVTEPPAPPQQYQWSGVGIRWRWTEVDWPRGKSVSYLIIASRHAVLLPLALIVPAVWVGVWIVRKMRRKASGEVAPPGPAISLRNRLRRTGRVLVRVACTLWLVAWVLLVVMWVRSYIADDWIALERPWSEEPAIKVRLSLESYLGRAGVKHDFIHQASGRTVLQVHWQRRVASFKDVTDWGFWKRMGFKYSRSPEVSPRTISYNGARQRWYVATPYWFIAIVTGIVPALWLRRLYWARQARQRVARGLCAACGYDLRASKERCPECGAEFSATMGAPS